MSGAAFAGQQEDTAFRRAFLVGVVNSQENADTLPPNVQDSHEDLVSMIGDYGAGSWSLRNVSVKLPAFWLDKVSNVYSAPLETVGAYQSVVALVQLRPQAWLPDAQRLGPYEFSCRQDELFRAIFSSWKHNESLYKATSCHQFANVLYLEPQSQIALNPSSAVPQPAITALLRKVGYHFPTACVPSMVVDTLLACGPGSSWDDLSATAIRLKPFTSAVRETMVPISHVALEAIRYFSLIEILDETDQRLSALSFAKLNVGDYLKQQVGRTRHPSLDDRYKQFMKDRQGAMEERFRATEVLARVKDKLGQNTMSNPKVKTLSFPAVSEGDIVQQDYFEGARQMALDRLPRISSLLEVIATRDSALAEYLRDATTAESTAAVDFLTRAAIGIALLGLIVGLVPEDLKRALARGGRRVLTWVRGRWRFRVARPPVPLRAVRATQSEGEAGGAREQADGEREKPLR
jgi:hypothetical protein